MDRHGVADDDQTARLSVGQRGKQIEEVFVHWWAGAAESSHDSLAG